MVEGYGWYRRGDWQIMTALNSGTDAAQQPDVAWQPSAEHIWGTLDFVLHFPAWLVMDRRRHPAAAFDHRLLQKTKIGEKPPTLRKRLKDWLSKLQREEEERPELGRSLHVPLTGTWLAASRHAADIFFMLDATAYNRGARNPFDLP